MKKVFFILVGVALALGILATAGFVYAATDDPPETETPEKTEGFPHRDFMGRRGRGGFGFFGKGDGILGDYIFPAIAEAFGLTDGQVAAFDTVRETLQNIKDELSIDEIHTKTGEAFASAAADALEDEVITSDQYEQMLERFEQMEGHEFGPLGGPGMRGGFGVEGFPTRGDGWIMKYLDAALADVLNVSPDELQTMKENGLNLRDYAEDNELTAEELHDLMKEIHTRAIQAAFEDDAITEDQYEMMMERLENSDGRLPFGPGFRGPRGHGW
jgi:hypothetical protein